MDKASKVRFFILIILGGFFVSVTYHYFLGTYLGRGYPSNTFLYMPIDRFQDFYNTIKFKDYTSVDYGNCRFSNYLPATFIISDLFRLIKPPNLSLFIFLFLSTVFVVSYSWRNLRNTSIPESITNALIFSIFTFPVIFTVDRSNFEFVIFILLCLFIYFYEKNKITLAIIPLSFAIAMKLFPAVFIVLLISDRKYKHVLGAIFLVIILSIFPLLALMDGGIHANLIQLFHNLHNYNSVAAIGNAGMEYGNSIFSILKGAILYLKVNPEFINVASKGYLIIVLILFSLISLYVILIESAFWKKVAILTISMCIFPYVSPDYKLIHFLIPIFLYINSSKLENISLLRSEHYTQEKKIDFFYILLFALLLIPKNYRFTFPFYPGIVFDPLIMLFLLFIIMYYGTVRLIKSETPKVLIINKLKFLFYLHDKNLK